MLSSLLVASLLSGAGPSIDAVLAPAVVEVAPDRPFTDVTLKNLGTEAREIVAEPLAWTQDEDGQATLSDTAAVTMVPARAELAPGEERRFRLTVLDPSAIRQRAYRIAVSAVSAIDGERVLALIPVFVLPEAPIESVSVQADCTGPERCQVVLANTGNVAVRPARIVLTIGSVRGPLAERDLDASWILPGERRRYEVALEPTVEPREVLVRVSLGTVERMASAINGGIELERVMPAMAGGGEPLASVTLRP